MTEDEAKPYAKPIPNWIPETRTIIVCWMMFSSFLTIVMCWWKPPSADSQLLNTLIGMYVGTGFITAITWWMGSAKGSDSQNKMQDKMSDALRPTPLPTAPPVAPAVVVAWWSLLTDAEKAAMTEAAKTDARIQALIAIFAAGKAESEHLEALVTAGLLTKQRAETLKTA